VFSIGKRAACFSQSKLPPSTITPPIDVPWPPTYFVVESIEMAAPCLIGWHSTGVAVLSTISGTPSSRPIFAISAIGKTVSFGLGRVSP